jgi:hypothetical protein
MKKFLTLCLGLWCSVSAFAQFVNNGATVTIQPGATLRVETHFLNNSGTVTNNGTLEVQDSFKNNATFFSGSSSIVRFVGSNDSKVKTSGSVLANVEMEKTNSTITLVDPLIMSGNFAFDNDNNKVNLGAHNFTLNSGGSVVFPCVS